MRGNFGKGVDDGQKLVKWVVGILIGSFVLWFLYEGIGLVGTFQ